MTAILVIALKDLRVLVRDRGALFWAMVFPIVFALLLGAVTAGIGRAPSLKVAVVDEDQSAASKKVMDALRDARGLAATVVDSAVDAERRVTRGEAVARVRIPKGFEQGTPLALSVDASRAAEGAVLEGVLAKAVPSCASTGVIREPDVFVSAPSGFALALPASVLWGLVGCAGAFASASVAERRAGTQLRLRAAPIGSSAILGGKLVACFVACALDALLLVVIARVALSVPFARVGVLALAIAACAAAFAGITLLLGVLGRSESSTGGSAWAVLLLFAMVGGAMVPLSVMPDWLRAIGNASPVKWGIVALEGATFRGLSLRELLPVCAGLVGVGAVTSAIAAGVFRRFS